MVTLKRHEKVGRNRYFSVSRKLRKEGKSSEEFEAMLSALTGLNAGGHYSFKIRTGRQNDQRKNPWDSFMEVPSGHYQRRHTKSFPGNY